MGSDGVLPLLFVVVLVVIERTKWKTALRDSARVASLTHNDKHDKIEKGFEGFCMCPQNDKHGKVENDFEGFCACPQNDKHLRAIYL
jgi:hypothetical protein